MAPASKDAYRERYEAFIASPQWAAIRKRWYAEHGKFCRGCGMGAKVHLHHRTYKRFGGDERTEDLVALCKTCHKRVHAYHKGQKKLSLADATDAWIEARQDGRDLSKAKTRVPNKQLGKERRKRRKKKARARQNADWSHIRTRQRPTPKPGPPPIKPGDEDLRAQAIAAGKFKEGQAA